MTAPPRSYPHAVGRPRRDWVVMRCAKPNCGARITMVDPDAGGRLTETLFWLAFGRRSERWEGLDDASLTGRYRYRCKCGKTHVIVLADAIAAAPRAKRLGRDLLAGAPGFGVP